MTEHIETVIIGGGQAGLALSYYLNQQRRQHVVLERGRVGESWRSQRWDAFTLITPNWTIQLPGLEYQGDDPDGFLPREAFVKYLERYAQSFNAPLREGVQVTVVQQLSGGDGYLVEAEEETFKADNVVLATGAYPKPKLPKGSDQLAADIYQLHSSQYHNSESLPSGAVLVVGTGQSGFQIAEELHKSGRQVYLSTSSCGKTPLRYRGKDVVWWLTKMGFFDRTVDQLPSPMVKFACSPHASNKYGVQDITLRQFAGLGITLLGHLQTAEGQRVILAPDLEDNLSRSEAFTVQIMRMIDGYIMKSGLQVPVHDETSEVTQSAAVKSIRTKNILTLDLPSADIRTVIWATGYKLDFSWVQIPVFDQTGYPIHQRGVTAYPGLYFLGLQWLYKTKSALLSGIGEDAAFIASAIAARN